METHGWDAISKNSNLKQETYSLVIYTTDLSLKLAYELKFDSSISKIPIKILLLYITEKENFIAIILQFTTT